MTYTPKNILLCTCMCFGLASCVTHDTAPNTPEICKTTEYFCTASENALVMGTSSSLPDYLPVIEGAYVRYSQFFKNDFLKTAIFTNDRISTEVKAALEKSGYDIILPWTPAKKQAGLSQDIIREQVTAQMPSASQAMIDQVVAQAQAQAQQSKKSDTPLQDPEMEAGVISHELAHMWFIKGPWARGNQSKLGEKVRQYGSTAPDWLDEISAVLTETGVMTKGRQRRLDTVIAADGLNALWPLETYFQMEHPVFKRAQSLIKMQEALGKTKQDGGIKTIRLTGEQARKFLETDSVQKPENFYIQSRAFADFMIETTKEPYIFDIITNTIKSGGSMEMWLAKSGKQYGLPGNTIALETQWQSWILARALKKLAP